MPSLEYPPVAWEAYFLRGFDYPHGAYEPYPIAGAPATLVGSAPYFTAADDGSYLEEQWGFYTGTAFGGLVFDNTWQPTGSPVDIAIDWRVYMDTEFGQVTLWFQSPGFVLDASAWTILTPGWNTGTNYLSQSLYVDDVPGFIAAFFGGEPGQQSFVQVEMLGNDEHLPAEGHTFRVDLIRVYVITEGGSRIPLQWAQRKDGAGRDGVTSWAAGRATQTTEQWHAPI